MKTANKEPRTPLTAVILTALVIGYAWGLTSLVGGMSEEQRPSSLFDADTGHLVRSESEGARR